MKPSLPERACLRSFLLLLLLISGILPVAGQNTALPAASAPGCFIRRELQLGQSFLTSKNLSGTKGIFLPALWSGAYNTDFRIARFPGKNIAVFTGIGLEVLNFGLNRLPAADGNQTIFLPLTTGLKIRYSNLQCMYADWRGSISWGSAMNSRNRNLEMEAGMIVGWLVCSESSYALDLSNGYLISTRTRMPNLSPMHYGPDAKISTRKIMTGGKFGYSLSLSGNYFLSGLFRASNQTPSGSFAVLAGIGIFSVH